MSAATAAGGSRPSVATFTLSGSHKNSILSKIKANVVGPTHDDIKENHHNRLFNLQYLDQSVGRLLHDLTKIPYNDDDILEKMKKKTKEFKSAVEQELKEDVFRLHEEILQENSRCAVSIQQREESRSKNPLYMIASHISQDHKNNGPVQIKNLFDLVFTEQDVGKAISSWYKELNPLVPLVDDEKQIQSITKKFDTAKEVVIAAKLNSDSFKEEWCKNALFYTSSRSYAILKGALSLFYDFLKVLYNFMFKKIFEKFPSLTMALMGSAINPRTGAILGLSTYFLNGDMNIDASTKGILNIGGACSVVYSVTNGLYFVITSETTYWLTQTLRTFRNYVVKPKMPNLIDIMSIFSNFWAFGSAIIRDINSLIPKFDDIFIVKIFKESHTFITTFQILCQILQDLHHHSEDQRVQIGYYIWRAGFYSYNLTAALNEPYQSLLVILGAKPNATFTEFIKTTFKETVLETATIFAEDFANDDEIQQKLVDKATAAIDKILEKKSDEFIDKTLKKIKQQIQEEMPEIIEKFPDFVQQVTEVLIKDEKFIEGMLGHTQELADTIVASVATSLFNATVSEDAQRMLPPVDQLNTSEKLSKAATTLVATGLHYMQSHPEAVHNFVDTVSPILEEGVKTAVSRGFGKAESEGFTNTAMLGLIKGAIGVGAEKAQSSILEQVGYIAGNAVRKVPGAVVNVATGLAEDVSKGTRIIVDAAGNVVDATMAMHYTLNPQTDYSSFVPPQFGTIGRFKNKKSTAKSLYKKKNVKSPKSVKNNRKKKSSLKSIRKKKSLLKRKL